ncbi:MAG: ABC transporter ATP-binding protein [Chloroflexi bacterium]|nr:ABC transporter ATP-binding protein [Chloroflexota bacterium]
MNNHDYEAMMTEPPVVVETHNLTRIYGDGTEIRALDGVNLTIRAGEFLAIVGPSGSGKSTLLNLLGALDRPTSGEVIIGGTPLSQVRDIDQFRGRTIGFVFQTHNLIPTLTAAENVEIPMYETELSRSERHARARELLALVGLAQRADHLPNQLSGGERQRVAIARALANRPTIVLADEPTGNLDSKITADIMALLRQLNREHGTTLIVVTHNHEVAFAARRLITLRDGRILSDQTVHSTFESELLDFKSSPLGQTILRGDGLPDALADLAPKLRELLEKV